MHEINKDELKHSRITIFEFSTDTVREERKRRKKSDEQSYCQVGIDRKKRELDRSCVLGISSG